MTDDTYATSTRRTTARTLCARAWEAWVGACITALIGAPLSGLLGLVAIFLVSDERPDTSPGSIAGLLLAAALAGYVLAGLPALIAGLALSALGRIATPRVAACSVGVLCVAIYFATLGAHLLPRAWADHMVLVAGLSAFIGTAVGARAALAALGSRRL